MKVGDLVKIDNLFASCDPYESLEDKIGMIVVGPNEVGKVRILMSSGQKMWLHCNEIELLPKSVRYLKE